MTRSQLLMRTRKSELHVRNWEKQVMTFFCKIFIR